MPHGGPAQTSGAGGAETGHSQRRGEHGGEAWGRGHEGLRRKQLEGAARGGKRTEFPLPSPASSSLSKSRTACSPESQRDLQAKANSGLLPNLHDRRKAGPDSPAGLLRRGRERAGPPRAAARPCPCFALPAVGPQRGAREPVAAPGPRGQADSGTQSREIKAAAATAQPSRTSPSVALPLGPTAPGLGPGPACARAPQKAAFGQSLTEGVSRARKPPKRREAGRADILEVSRVGSHEVSEALVSKRATREAEREEMGYRGEPRGGAEAQRRKTHRAAPRPGRTRVGGRTCGGKHSSQ